MLTKLIIISSKLSVDLACCYIHSLFTRVINVFLHDTVSDTCNLLPM